ncbi:hypothetical protein ECANGB1_744 [Enterospora canceri]|uniref:Ubiquitin-like protease family profile domain-containing protein n=1 Tax=Enterospora canceri TaxID=1081671 RepID=A0A1Y1S8M4_9MICR|nr:hypothetical protein ECANGB1_744 [Enterospora canceri]
MFGSVKSLLHNAVIFFHLADCATASTSHAASLVEEIIHYNEPTLNISDLNSPADADEFSEKYYKSPIKNISEYARDLIPLIKSKTEECTTQIKQEDANSFLNDEELTQYAIDAYVRNVLSKYMRSNDMIVNSGCMIILNQNEDAIKPMDEYEKEMDIARKSKRRKVVKRSNAKENHLLDLLLSESGNMQFADYKKDGTTCRLKSMDALCDKFREKDNIYFIHPMTATGVHWYLMHFDRREKRTTIYDSKDVKQSLHEQPNMNNYIKWNLMMKLLGGDNYRNVAFCHDLEFEQGVNDCGIQVLGILRELILKREVKRYDVKKLRPFLLHELYAEQMIYINHHLPEM